MLHTLYIAGWFLTALDLIAAVVLFFSRDGGDAATRGIGRGLATLLAAIALVAAALLLWGRRDGVRPQVLILGSLVALAPVALAITLTLSRQGLGLIFASLREPKRQYLASPRYEYPDAATREAALALVLNDYKKLDALLHAAPAPNLSARDERGESLLGVATRAAIMDGGSLRDLEGLRLLLAAGARPQGDDYGREESLIEAVADAKDERRCKALEMLLDAGLNPDTPMSDGRPVLFHTRLTPEAARILLAHGVNRTVNDTRGGANDWSPVTYQAHLGNWATALVLLQSGVPRDHGSPPGSVLERVLKNLHQRSRDQDAEKAYQAFLAALKP
ncbi:MAG: hypothetical protein JST93_36435 [Acidobacteria bacterium]|nr:hypothetical protein [Acidobacteriota bacterium]